jgi:hypothetical protein
MPVLRPAFPQPGDQCAALCGLCAARCAGESMADQAEEQWLTYRELGALLGCTANAARMHAHRRGWPRRAPNRVGDPARVLVLESGGVRERASHEAAQCVAQASGSVQALEQAHVRAIEALREQLAIANRRIDELFEERRREAEERRRLMALLTDRRPWWRRWFR